LIDSGDAGAGAIGALGVIEDATVEIAESEMGKIEIADIPGRLRNRVAANGLAEEREFEAEAMAV